LQSWFSFPSNYNCEKKLSHDLKTLKVSNFENKEIVGKTFYNNNVLSSTQEKNYYYVTMLLDESDNISPSCILQNFIRIIASSVTTQKKYVYLLTKKSYRDNSNWGIL